MLAAPLRESRGPHPELGESYPVGRLHQPQKQQQRKPSAFCCEVSTFSRFKPVHNMNMIYREFYPLVIAASFEFSLFVCPKAKVGT